MCNTDSFKAVGKTGLPCSVFINAIYGYYIEHHQQKNPGKLGEMTLFQ
jgi:hypothetical protein